MFIKKQEIDSIRDNKVTYIKNFVDLKKQYDFNLLSRLVEETDAETKVKAKNLTDVMRGVYQMKNIKNHFKEFVTFFDFLKKLFNYEDNVSDEVDLFFSFCSLVGMPHADPEDVFIISLHGVTTYRIFSDKDMDIVLNKGDMIYIPRGIKHKVLAMTPRVIASFGYYGKKLNGISNS